VTVSVEALRESIRRVLREEMQGNQGSGHKSIEEMIACPDCFPKIRKLVLRKVGAEDKNLSHQCEKCGLGVDGKESASEDWDCPFCGHKYAKRRE